MRHARCYCTGPTLSNLPRRSPTAAQTSHLTLTYSGNHSPQIKHGLEWREADEGTMHAYMIEIMRSLGKRTKIPARWPPGSRK
ncbi:hypothetical protein O988_06819 [Pseudogymnoascus sp. VKM F-3808]|nr:hypothetical protein O988_06819 [Pseudogymnoascus sp. VKM F-3808]